MEALRDEPIARGLTGPESSMRGIEQGCKESCQSGVAHEGDWPGFRLEESSTRGVGLGVGGLQGGE